MTEELKPCPRCGGEPFEWEEWSWDGMSGAFVECEKCGYDVCGFEREEAREEWNRRYR